MLIYMAHEYHPHHKSRVSSQHPALIPQEQISKSLKTPRVDFSIRITKVVELWTNVTSSTNTSAWAVGIAVIWQGSNCHFVESVDDHFDYVIASTPQ
jgi:hypothetical protein